MNANQGLLPVQTGASFPKLDTGHPQPDSELDRSEGKPVAFRSTARWAGVGVPAGPVVVTAGGPPAGGNLPPQAGRPRLRARTHRPSPPPWGTAADSRDGLRP